MGSVRHVSTFQSRHGLPPSGFSDPHFSNYIFLYKFAQTRSSYLHSDLKMETESPHPERPSQDPFSPPMSLKRVKYTCIRGLMLLWAAQFVFHAIVYHPGGFTDDVHDWMAGVAIPSAIAQFAGLLCLWIPLSVINSPFLGAMGLTTAASVTAILGYLAVVSDSPTHDLKTYWTCLTYPTIIILTIFTIVFLAFGEHDSKSKERDVEMGGYFKVQDSGEDGEEEGAGDVTLKEPQEEDVTEVAREEGNESTLESFKLLQDEGEA